MASRTALRLLALACCCLLRLGGVDARSLRAQFGRPSMSAIAESMKAVMQRRASSDVYYVTTLLDRLKVFAHNADAESERRYRDEHDRLTSALELTADGSSDRQSVQMALKYADEDRLERQVALTEILEYYYTAKSMLGATSTAPDCRFLACGAHATCAMRSARAVCECDQCYEGDGFTCRPVPCTPKTLGSAVPVRGPVPQGFPVVSRQQPGRVEELHLAVFGQDQIAVVIRDVTAGNRGSLIVGRVKDMAVEFGLQQVLSLKPAFGPRVVGMSNGRLIITFRDSESGGIGFVMGAQVNSSTAIQALLSAPMHLSHGQTKRAELVALSASRAVCLFAENALMDGVVQRSWGTAALVEVKRDGVVQVHGKYHFSQGFELSHFSAVALSPTSMVAAFRAMPLPSRPAGGMSRELSAVWMGLDGDELLIDPHPIGLEPERRRMFARSLALVSENTFSYAYESELDQATKMAVLRVDPTTHRMTIISAPKVLAQGSVRFLASLSLPSNGESPMTFTMFQRPQESCMAETCRVSPMGRVADCKDIAWADHELIDVSTGRLSDGRSAFAFATTSGEMMYQLLTPKETGAVS
mmetsp:Transcript_30217/g.87069  ORF Transcript_30217/g.87069 Transcript_30217/m.87069 type:complete len:586 (+) Transcript_30217:90-1847(+)